MIQTAGMCAPATINNYKKRGSCLSFSELKTLAVSYNKIVDGNSSKSELQSPMPIPLSSFKSFKMLYNALNERFLPVCGDKQEHCWIEQDMFKSSQTHKSIDLYKSLCKRFRPLMNRSWIKNRQELLETYDILRVMKQYDEFYSDFAFLGVFPIDFMKKNDDTSQCVVNRICQFDLDDFLKKGIKQFGAVLNFDPHDQPGSHWVAFYMNFDEKDSRYGFFYYDSYATIEPQEVRSFFEIAQRQFIKMHKDENTFEQEYQKSPFVFKRNQYHHQYKDTECGMFSIIFLILCLENPKTTINITLKNKLFPKCDDMINKNRDTIYRKHPTEYLKM